MNCTFFCLLQNVSYRLGFGDMNVAVVDAKIRGIESDKFIFPPHRLPWFFPTCSASTCVDTCDGFCRRERRKESYHRGIISFLGDFLTKDIVRLLRLLIVTRWGSEDSEELEYNRNGEEKKGR